MLMIDGHTRREIVQMFSAKDIPMKYASLLWYLKTYKITDDEIKRVKKEIDFVRKLNSKQT